MGEDPAAKRNVDVNERAFDFAVRIVKLCKYLEKSRQVGLSVCEQLLKSGTSVGANLEEALPVKVGLTSYTKVRLR